MHCTNCGAEIKDGSKFCKSCGTSVGSSPVQAEVVATTTPNVPATDTSSAIIKCGNCGYIGEGEHARKLGFTILAWMCVVFAPLITIIYFVGTHKWRCPKCKSTFLGIKNKEGVFVGQRGGAGRVVSTIVLVLVGIAIMGILASVVLASLNTARQKGNEAQQKELGASSVDQTNGWQLYNSVADSFSIEFPEFPTYESQSDDGGEVAYDYHTYNATKETTSFQVIKYIYKDEIDVSEPDNLLERYLNGFVNGIGNGTLVSSNYTYAGKYRALDFQVSTTDNEDVKGRLVLVGQTLYLIAVDYFPKNYSETDYQKFVSSFMPK